MRSLRDEKRKGLFLKAEHMNGDFVFTVPQNVQIKGDTDITVYAKLKNNTKKIPRFTVGVGRIAGGSPARLKLTKQDSRITLNNSLEYYVRVPQKKNNFFERIIKAVSEDNSQDD